MKIYKLKAKKIYNSRNEPTIEVIAYTDNGKFRASSPAGASTGRHEVIAFPKEGIYKSIDFVNKILRKELYDYEINKFEDLKRIETLFKKYDNTKDLSKLGGNTIIALEFALLKALAQDNVWKFLNPNARALPRPLGNCIGGGMHVKEKNKLEFQEFLLLSLNALSFVEAVDANYRIYKLLKHELKTRRITDEGAWAPDLPTEKVLDILTRVTKAISGEFGFNIRIGIDIAASRLWNGKHYTYRKKRLTRNQQIGYVIDLINKYNFCYVEDPLQENDFIGYAEITDEVKTNCLVAGDDLTCTNPELLKRAIRNNSITAVIVKPNQIGSLIKMAEVIETAKKHNIYPVISHRSGETREAIISDFAVGFNVPIIKCGIYGKERTAKIDRLTRIEKEIKKLHTNF